MARLDKNGREIRRQKGDGGLFQRADGMWIGRVELPAGPDGERRRKTVSSKEYDVAAAALRKLRSDVDSGKIAVTSATTLEKWLDRWINEIHAHKVRPTTLDDYRRTIKNHIVPAIGGKRLDKLTPQHVRDMHRKIGPSRTCELAHVVLQKALKDAVRERMLTVNVAELVDRPRYKRAKRTSLSVDVAKHVLRTAIDTRTDGEATRWIAAFLTGARQGELLGLRWSHVDLEHGVMDISWQLQQLSQVHGCGDPDADGAYPCRRKRPGWCPDRRWDLPPDFDHEICHRSLLWTRPKSEAGGREIPIITPLLGPLRAMHKRQGINPHDLVWHYPDGRPIRPRADYGNWKSLLTAAGVLAPGETMPLHVARHTAATMLRAAGVDEQTRMEILGHATVDSQRVYAHADRARHLTAMDSLAELLAADADD
ncbi:MAG: site-specific integrase [Actinomycetota bacterium]